MADVDADGQLDILSADDANESDQELWLNTGIRASLSGSGRLTGERGGGVSRFPRFLLREARGGLRVDALGRHARP